MCNLTESSYAKNRHLALEILRNMSFNNENRAALLSSSDFQRVMYTVLDKEDIGDEQLFVSVAIWKLVANNAKGKNIIKNSPVLSKLRALNDAVVQNLTDIRVRLSCATKTDNEISSSDETLEDLAVVLKQTIDILSI